MKSSKIWKIIWVSGIYILLLSILYMIVIYKVKWEYRDFNTYLYIYDCNRELCTSTTRQENYYNRILCEDNLCPYIEHIIADSLILKKDTKSWLYNYINGEVIDNKYVSYRYIGNNMYVVSDSLNNYGIIDNKGTILIDIKYNYIDDYKNNYISYIKDNLYGIITDKGASKVDSMYEDLILINDKVFAARKDNIYQFYSYDNININLNKYNYVYSTNDIILVINNKKIDILDNNFNSTLLMKIDCFYSYSIEKERDSLNIYSDGKNIYFRVFESEDEYTDYIYNIKSQKLIN